MMGVTRIFFILLNEENDSWAAFPQLFGLVKAKLIHSEDAKPLLNI